jgi:pimeloyl-ACP methyl ester carboxylesterase
MPVPILLLPGLMCDATVWREQIPALERFGPCTVADYGTIASLAGMAHAVLARAPKEFAVAGHSMGGRVALEVFRAAPDRVKGLALLDTGCAPLAKGEAGIKEVEGRMSLLEVARAKGTKTMAQRWVQGMVHRPRLKDAPLIDAIVEMMGRKTPDIFEAQQGALIARPEACSLLSGIKVPALVLCGRHDSWSSPEQHESMAKAISGAALAIVEDCGHMCTMERPEEISAHLVRWIEAVAPS